MSPRGWPRNPPNTTTLSLEVSRNDVCSILLALPGRPRYSFSYHTSHSAEREGEREVVRGFERETEGEREGGS